MKQTVLPGMEDLLKDSESEEELYEGRPKKANTYFDAAALPDAPGYQPSAKAAEVYTLYVLFETQEQMRRAIKALTFGNRSVLSSVARLATLPAARKYGEKALFELWEERILGEGDGNGSKSGVPISLQPIEPVEDDVSEAPKLGDENVLIAFPTYKRVGNVKTFEHVDDVLAFVEPQEEAVYRAIYPDRQFETYDRNGMTITEKRQYIVDRALERDVRYLFMLEDDLTGFYLRNGKTAGGNHKLVRSDYTVVLDQMLACMYKWGLTQLGLSQQQSNFHYEEPEFKLSCKITELVLLDLQRMGELGVGYDTSLRQFEDFDLTIQILAAGGRAALYTPAAFGHVTMGENAGGHQADGLRQKQTEEAVYAMQAKYPEWVEIKQGRLFLEPKVNWKALRERIV